MRPLHPARLAAATVALCSQALLGSLIARAQLYQPVRPATLEMAALLPDAPGPQAGDTPASAASQAVDASASSSQPVTQPYTPPSATDPAAAAAAAKQKQHAQAEQELKTEEKQRLLGVMPQFQVVMNGQAAPLTGAEKWKLALHTAIDPFYIGWAFVIGGGYGELVDSNRGYNWGPGGYFWRVGANYADNVNGALIGNALLPQLLHQDPRYFRKGTGPVFKRFLYAAESTVVCHGDNGKRQVNVSNVLGNYISGAISNAYYPVQQRGVALTLENGTSVTLFGALGGQVLEFGPDLARLLHRKKNTSGPGPQPVPTPGAGTTLPAAAVPPASH